MSTYDFSKFDKAVDIAGLKNDIQDAAANSGGDFKEVPLGAYEIKIKKLELKLSKKGDPMVSCWMQILEGEYKGQLLFMNQVVTKGFQVHIVNDFLRSLQSGEVIQFESYSQYAQLLMDVAEAIDGKKEYALDYGEKNGFNTFKITEVFELANA
jgi:hypothetical protein